MALNPPNTPPKGSGKPPPTPPSVAARAAALHRQAEKGDKSVQPPAPQTPPPAVKPRQQPPQDQRESGGHAQPNLGNFTTRQVLGVTDAAVADQSHVDKAREKGFQNTPSAGEIAMAKGLMAEGTPFGEFMPRARAKAAESLPPPEIEPPIFLSTFEGMKDIYLRTRHRASNRTREILEGTDLEDLINMLAALQEKEEHLRKGEARVRANVLAGLGGEPGPILHGFQDARLSEPWRLFLEGWDVWVGDRGGVELFWEGEAEDDEGQPIELLQVLRYKELELTLETRVGALSDTVSYDGESFYRLKDRGGN